MLRAGSIVPDPRQTLGHEGDIGNLVTRPTCSLLWFSVAKANHLDHDEARNILHLSPDWIVRLRQIGGISVEHKQNDKMLTKL